MSSSTLWTWSNAARTQVGHQHITAVIATAVNAAAVIAAVVVVLTRQWRL
jgi:hypothetical protein